MQKTTNVTKNVKLDATTFVNSDTGETLASEIKDNTISIVAKVGTEHFTIKSDEYVVFDSAAIKYLMENIPGNDMARVVEMSNMLKADCSVIMNGNNHPHNAETLQVKLSLSRSKFYRFVNRLVSKGILAYCVCAPSGFIQKVYMLNPYIARKRKTLHCELKAIFNDIPTLMKLAKENKQAV